MSVVRVHRSDTVPAAMAPAGAGDDILVEKSHVSVVTLNRPAKKNAISFAMWRHLAAGGSTLPDSESDVDSAPAPASLRRRSSVKRQ